MLVPFTCEMQNVPVWSDQWFDSFTPGPSIMQIYLVQNLTSARFGEKPFNIHLVQNYSTSEKFSLCDFFSNPKNGIMWVPGVWFCELEMV